MAFLTDTTLLLAACMLLGAALYSSVGHAGASAYIALMVLFGVAPGVMRPTALTLNILVAGLTSYRYVRAGAFSWQVLWPFLLGAMPMAFLGGTVELPVHVYRPLVGVVLVISAIRMLWPKELRAARQTHAPPVLVAIGAGAGLGLLAGMTGTGGGIFLSPLLIFLAWGAPRSVSGISAVFILCNSIAGLLGNLASLRALPPELPWYAGAVLVGALIGTSLGIRLAVPGVIKALGIVLLIAGVKLIGVY
ncbi:MAG: sulfite exporter TauE/SafE family protein [Acetobacteraceae bacterium]|nr:sulfite exporter TauE/SafE family protein [Acetobacteraceae bacterium]